MTTSAPFLVRFGSSLAIPLFMGVLVVLLVRLSYVRRKKRYMASGYDTSGMGPPSYLRIFVAAAAGMCLVMWVARKMTAIPSSAPPSSAHPSSSMRGGGGADVGSDSDSIVSDMLHYIDRSEAPF
jgi:hypothetical protein